MSRVETITRRPRPVFVLPAGNQIGLTVQLNLVPPQIEDPASPTGGLERRFDDHPQKRPARRKQTLLLAGG